MTRTCLSKKVTCFLKIGLIPGRKLPKVVGKCSHGSQKQKKFGVSIDFKDVNKLCPNDSFPVPNIDWMVSATAGHEIMSSLSVYSWHNLIQKDLEDQDNFFCHELWHMLLQCDAFWLKEWKQSNKMFEEKIGKPMEVYIDDTLVKSLEIGDHQTHPKETFNILRKNYKSWTQKSVPWESTLVSF